MNDRKSSFRDRAKAWFFLFRPWSYTATLVPFLVAAGMLAHVPDVRWGRWGLGFVAGLFFQATVNLLNTWGDERSGVDDAPGAIRTTPQVHDGLVSMPALLVAALVCAAVAGLLGTGLCWYRVNADWRFDSALLVAGFIGFLGSLNYSTGIKFKYHGLGVPFVSFLMGPLEIFVALQLLRPATAELLFSPGPSTGLRLASFALLTVPIAALVGVIMHGNDMRDIPSDRAAGITTLASWLGPRGALVHYWACHVLPYVVCGVPAVLALLAGPSETGYGPYAFWLPFLCLPLTVKTLVRATRTYRAAPVNPPWRRLERGSGGVLTVFGLLYALALALGR